MSGVTWTPIGTSSAPFTGTFDGNGMTISNLTINNPSSDYQGLFGMISTTATVKNVGVTGNITGKNYVGGVVGYNRGTVENCYSACDVSGNQYVGGLVGVNDYTGIGTVKNCYTTGNVSASSDVGGVIGSNYKIMENSYATGAISGSSYVGGLAGNSPNSTGEIKNCVALNQSITRINGTSTILGRVAGSVSGTITGNKERNDIVFSGVSITVSSNANGIHGLDVATSGTVSLSTYVFDGWSSSIWEIPVGYLTVGGDLPTLIGLGTQNLKLPTP